MLIKIGIVVALCSGITYSEVEQKVEYLAKLYPGAKVSVRIDNKASCIHGRVLTSSESKLLKSLAKH